MFILLIEAYKKGSVPQKLNITLEEEQKTTYFQQIKVLSLLSFSHLIQISTSSKTLIFFSIRIDQKIAWEMACKTSYMALLPKKDLPTIITDVSLNLASANDLLLMCSHNHIHFVPLTRVDLMTIWYDFPLHFTKFFHAKLVRHSSIFTTLVICDR